jgi:hypothetical protein
MQQQGHWQPQCPSKQAWKALKQANSVYDLQYRASHLMDACRLWIPGQINLAQSHQSGKLPGLADADRMQPQKVLSQDNQTAKGHLNQTRKNVRSTKVKATPLETCNTSHLHGKKVRDVYTQTYMT